jgi:hypothetical protein
MKGRYIPGSKHAYTGLELDLKLIYQLKLFR